MITGPGMWGGNLGKCLCEMLDDIDYCEYQHWLRTKNEKSEPPKLPKISLVKKFLMLIPAYRIGENMKRIDEIRQKAKEKRIMIDKMMR